MSSSRRSTGLTPAAERTVARCRRLASTSADHDSWVAFLVLTLVRDESLASACLRRLGITVEWLTAGHLGQEVARAAAVEAETDDTEYEGDGCQPIPRPFEAIDDPLDFSRVLDRSKEIARRGLSDGGVSSANLLLAIIETHDFIRDRFSMAGATEERIRNELVPSKEESTLPLPIEEELNLSEEVFQNTSLDHLSISNSIPRNDMVWRVIDANLNRVREGLRVLEDFARFIINSEVLSSELKTLRHELVGSEKHLLQTSGRAHGDHSTLAHRDTVGDVGTDLTTANERWRGSLSDVVAANCRRVQESIRSLEEFGKLLSPDFAATMKQLRYQSYTIEKSLLEHCQRSLESREALSGRSALAEWRSDRLKQATLYVLITESMCHLPWQTVVEQALLGGADVLQLREKGLNDRELIRRSSWMQAACKSAGAIFIVNDRPDIAAVCSADGVHVGQEEFSVEEARRILQPDQLVGVSTHNSKQADQAVAAGADYLGVGPIFQSQTKSFDSFPGLEFARSAASRIRRPWFAIGGITLDNLQQLLGAGATRVAVTSALNGSPEPTSTARKFQQQLREHSPHLGFTLMGDTP